jgi:hypothetical protein
MILNCRFLRHTRRIKIFPFSLSLLEIIKFFLSLSLSQRLMKQVETQKMSSSNSIVLLILLLLLGGCEVIISRKHLIFTFSVLSASCIALSYAHILFYPRHCIHLQFFFTQSALPTLALIEKWSSNLAARWMSCCKICWKTFNLMRGWHWIMGFISAIYIYWHFLFRQNYCVFNSM